MGQLDFSEDGINNMIDNFSNEVLSSLLFKTRDVKRSLFEYLGNNPGETRKIVNLFRYLLSRRLSPTEKIDFYHEWNNSTPLDVLFLCKFQLLYGNTDEINSVIKKVNDIIFDLYLKAEDNLEDAYDYKVTDEVKSRNKDSMPKSKQFYEYLISKEPELLAEKLKNEFGGKKGKTIAIMILALEKLKKIIVPIHINELYRSIRDYFGDIGVDQGINKYYAPYKQGTNIKRSQSLLTDDEIESFKNKIASFGC